MTVWFSLEMFPPWDSTSSPGCYHLVTAPCATHTLRNEALLFNRIPLLWINILFCVSEPKEWLIALLKYKTKPTIYMFGDL